MFHKTKPARIGRRLDDYTLAYCPYCGEHVAVFVRFGDELVCRDCARRGEPFDVLPEDQERGM